MNELLSVTDARLANNPIGVLCTLSRRVPFKKFHDFEAIRNTMRTASTAAEVCGRGFERGLFLEPLMSKGCLPRNFVVFQSSKVSGEEGGLGNDNILELMGIIGAVDPDALSKRGGARLSLSNKEMIKLLTKGGNHDLYRSQTLFDGEDSRGSALIVYSLGTGLKGARLEIGVSEAQAELPEFSPSTVLVRVTRETYLADRYLYLP